MNNALHGYNLHSQPSSSAGGGVALYTSKQGRSQGGARVSVTPSLLQAFFNQTTYTTGSENTVTIPWP